MVSLLEDQLLHEPAWRVGARAVADVALTIPIQHLEAHMARVPNRTAPVIYTVTAVAGATLALVGGTNAAALAVGLLVAISTGSLAVIGWRRVLPLRQRETTRHWWALALAGPVLVGAVIAGAGLGVNAWFLGMLCVFCGLGFTVVGLGLGVVRLVTRPAPSTPG